EASGRCENACLSSDFASFRSFFMMPPIAMGYAVAHPRLKALGFQPSALLPSEAAAAAQKSHTDLPDLSDGFI
ncbi:MAG: hypothetical protein ACI4UL_07155, partial [Muribaculaceae bacterium]